MKLSTNFSHTPLELRISFKLNPEQEFDIVLNSNQLLSMSLVSHSLHSSYLLQKNIILCYGHGI